MTSNKQTDTTKRKNSEDDGSVTIKIEMASDAEETEEILPELLVSVQVEEKNDAQALDFSFKPKQRKPRAKKNENLKPQKRRKVFETPEKRKERLERDRARKSWDRKNETPEQRKARLEYHKKYKRKSRAKPKVTPEVPKSLQNHNTVSKGNQIKQDIYDPLAESETIIVKIEPEDIDGISSNPYESPPNDSDITPNESDSTQNDSSVFLNREELPYTIQCAIVSKMFKGRPLDDICKLYNTTPEVVNEIWENRDKYEVQKLGHRSHKHFNAKIEKKILEWMKQQKDNNIQVSGKMIQNVAEGYAKELGFVAFDGSRKWLDRFKKKHDIMFRTRKRDYKALPDNKIKTQFFTDQWAEAREGLNDEDIYVADEVGLFYNPSKNRIQKLRSKKFVQGCIKDRLSIFLCTNASGRDKKKLLVCGTEDPILHSHRDPQTLPVLYVRHAQAHFTTRIFEEYVTCWNKELEQCNKKALLILDRATIHTKLQLSNLKLLFLPYKSKNSLVPIKNGIYSRFRDEFRRLILEDKVMGCAKGVDRNLTCLEALYMLEKAWERTPPEVITMTFFSLGYDVTMPDSKSALTPTVAKNDEETMCEILKNYDVENYYTDLTLLDEYLTVDDDLVTGQGTNPSVFGGNHKATPKNEVEEHLPIGTEKPESADIETTTKKTRVIKDMEIVKKYLQSIDTPFETYCAFMEVEKFVMRLPRCADA